MTLDVRRKITADRLTASSDARQVRSECLGDFLESIGGSVLQSAEGYGVMRLCLGGCSEACPLSRKSARVRWRGRGDTAQMPPSRLEGTLLKQGYRQPRLLSTPVHAVAAHCALVTLSVA